MISRKRGSDPNEKHIERTFEKETNKAAAAAASGEGVSKPASLLAMRTGYKGDPREILHFASWHATGRREGEVRVFVTAREEFTDRYRRMR